MLHNIPSAAAVADVIWREHLPARPGTLVQDHYVSLQSFSDKNVNFNRLWNAFTRPRVNKVWKQFRSSLDCSARGMLWNLRHSAHCPEGKLTYHLFPYTLTRYYYATETSIKPSIRTSSSRGLKPEPNEMGRRRTKGFSVFSNKSSQTQAHFCGSGTFHGSNVIRLTVQELWSYLSIAASSYVYSGYNSWP